MNYYIAKSIPGNFEKAVDAVVAALKTEGFGILTDIDVTRTLKDKIGVSFRKYRILGACNPGYAHSALQLEDKIGVLLPCSVIVQETGPNLNEAAVMNPSEMMSVSSNQELRRLSEEVTEKLARALEKVSVD